MFRASVFVLAAALAIEARADVSLTEKTSLKLAAFVPPELQKQMQQQTGTGSGYGSLRIKGDKAYATDGKLRSIVDFGRNEITLLNPETKQFATAPLDEYARRLATAFNSAAPPPEVEQVARAVHLDVQTKKTGQQAIIRGLHAEELLVTVSLQMPVTLVAASTMRMEMHYWITGVSELRDKPELKELADYLQRSEGRPDVLRFLEGTVLSLPGMDIDGAVAQVMKTTQGLPLKLETDIFIPAFTQMLQLSGQGGPNFDPNVPMAVSTMELTDVSTAAVEDSFFRVPANYKPAALEELTKAMIPPPSTLPAVGLAPPQ